MIRPPHADAFKDARHGRERVLTESGSNAPGIEPAIFDLAAGTALRVEAAADALRPIFSTYWVFDSDGTTWPGAQNIVLPGWAKIWIGLTTDPLDVKVGSRRYPSLARAVLFGPTSRAVPVTSFGGLSVVVDIGPLAWARLFAVSAVSLRDAVVPLDRLFPLAWTADLVFRIERCDRGGGLKAVLDDFFLERLPPPHRDEGAIVQILSLLADPGTSDLADISARIGMDHRTLLRLTKYYFGIPPKLLSMRTRFLRGLTALILDDASHRDDVPAGYYDVSHFIRDGKRFLGMTPRRFLALDQQYLRAALRARIFALGAPLASLDRSFGQPN